MAKAERSRHRFVYYGSREESPRPQLPANVTPVLISRRRRRALQYVLNGPYLWPPVASSRGFSKRAVGGLMKSGAGAQIDLALWPHAFTPVPPGAAPAAVIAHDLIHHRLPQLFSRRELHLRRQAERSLAGCALVLCPSASTAADLVETYPTLRDRVTVFPEGPGIVPKGEPSPGALAELRVRVGPAPFFLSVGFDWPHKNFEVLLEAMRKFKGRPIRLVFAGGRRRDTLVASIRRHGLEGSVVDLGPVSQELLDVLYRSATALLFPSLYEGFGIPLVEAMHYGLPIVASDRASVPEVVGSGGWIVPAQAPGEWASAIDALATQQAVRAELAQRSVARATDYTWAGCWEVLDKAFEGVTAAPRPA